MEPLRHRAVRSTALVALVLASAAASAQSTKISGSLAFDPGAQGEDVHSPLFTPDGTRLLYEADGLFSVLTDGSAGPVQLSSVDVGHPVVSPDGSVVVFSDTNEQLWSRSVDGSTPAILLGTVGHVTDEIGITPDGTKVVFQNSGLWAVPIDGSSSAVELADAMSVYFHWRGEISADGEWAIFVDAPSGTCLSSRRLQMYSVRLDGSAAPQTLSNFAGFGVEEYALDPLGTYVVISARPVCGSLTAAVFSVPIDGSAPAIQLSATSAHSILELAISPDGMRVVYTADPTSNVIELFSVPIDGSAAQTRLNPPLGTGMDVGGIAGRSFQISPDGTTVAYVADQRFDGVVELFGVPIGGGTSTELAGGMVTGGDVRAFEIGPLSLGVTFIADKLVDGVDELFSAGFGGGATFYLNSTLVAGGDVVAFTHSPDDQYIVFRADRTTDELYELYRVPVTGGLNRRLNGALVSGGDVDSFLISPDATSVAYLADETTDDVRELYARPLAGNTPSVRLNHALPLGGQTGDVKAFAVTPDSQTVLYLADGETEGVVELYRVPAGGGSVTKLSGTMVPGGSLHIAISGDPDPDWLFEVTSDGTRVVYLADQETDDLPELFSVPVDGSAAPLKLNNSFGAGSTGSRDFALTPDGTRVVYRERKAGAYDLWSAPTDASNSAVQLDLPGQNVGLYGTRYYAITSDGRYVIYRTANELWRVRTDRSDAPVRLSDPMVSGGELYLGSDLGSAFQISADGRWVAYLADALVDGRLELFLVPIEGSGPAAAPIRVNPQLVAGGNVTNFAISPNGRCVVYRADQVVDGQFDLYASVRGLATNTVGETALKMRAGVRTRLKLNGQSDGNVLNGIELAPDGEHVLFGAGQVNDWRLYVARTHVAGSDLEVATEPTGSYFSPDGAQIVFRDELNVFAQPSGLESGPTLLSTPGCDVAGWDPLVGADGRWIAYLSDGCSAPRRQLYLRPLDGSLSTLLVSGPMQPAGDVYAQSGISERYFAITPDSSRVIYMADQDLDGVIELYSTPLPELP